MHKRQSPNIRPDKADSLSQTRGISNEGLTGFASPQQQRRFWIGVQGHRLKRQPKDEYHCRLAVISLVRNKLRLIPMCAVCRPR